jgi:prolyl oligopeptidase
LKKIYSEGSPEYGSIQVRPGRMFAIKKQPPLQQPMLVTRVLVDPNQLDPSGGTAIDFYVASLDGKKAAISISKGGSERGDLYIYDVQTCQALSDVITRVQIPTGGGSFAWTADGKGLYYTRYPRPGERPDEDLDFYQQIYLHEMGRPAAEDQHIN